MAPSDRSAAAQSSVSAMPGTLVRSASRSRWTKPTTSRASCCGRRRDPREDDLVFLLGRRIVDPVVQAAPLQCVVDLARPVGCEDHARRPLGLDRADLGDRDLEVGQDLEQVRLELLVRAVDLVDQQDRRDTVIGLERLEERPADEELRAEDVVGGRLGRHRRAPPAAGSRASGAGSSTRRPRC